MRVCSCSWLPLLLCLAAAGPSSGEETAPQTAADAVPAAAGVPAVEELLALADKTLSGLSGYSGTFVRQERVGGKLTKQINRFKFAKPFKVYLYFVEPYRGREVIFVRGWNDDELKVHKGAFPDVTVNLDPRGSMAMDGHHHSVVDFGLQKTAEMCARNLRRLRERKQGEVRVEDGGSLFGRSVWKVSATFPKTARRVKVGEDETLWDVARRTGQDMYWILYSNPGKGWDEADDVDDGDEVLVPDYYGGRAELLVDKGNGLPVRMSIWDWRDRLYECYEYPELKLDPVLSARDFDPDNPAYNF